MEYQELKECAKYSNLRTSTFTKDTYISTENMLPNKGGVTSIDSIPTCKTTAKYESSDILISNIRPYFCKIWFATREGGCSNDVLVIKAKKTIEPKFLYYVLSDKNFFNYDTITSKGTKMPRGNKNAIMKYLVPKFSPLTQQKISSILSAYDRLIENNTRRIRLLEQMAENLYKEWFVRFRFPEHEKVEMVNGLPKGWKIKKVSNVCETMGGGTPTTTNPAYWGGDIKWVTPSDITSKNSLALLKVKGRITEEGLKKSSAKLLPPYTILMTSRASIGFFGICPDSVCTNQGFISIIPNKETFRMYLLYTFKSRKEEIISNANGSTFLEISKGRFRKMTVLVPPEDILDSFEKKTLLMFKVVLHLEYQNQLLTRQRDLLLPRLMSGKLEVKS